MGGTTNVSRSQWRQEIDMSGVIDPGDLVAEKHGQVPPVGSGEPLTSFSHGLCV